MDPQLKLFLDYVIKMKIIPRAFYSHHQNQAIINLGDLLD